MLPEVSANTLRSSLTAVVGKATDAAEALHLYRMLLLARRAEERVRQEYPADEIKTPVHLSVGQEAIPVGVCHVVPTATRFFGTYRNHALYLAVTQDTDGFFAELYGKVTGPSKGKAGSMHLCAPERGLVATSAVVGTTIPLAVGAALANAYRDSDDLVVVFFGDGAVEEGVFWESMNFACLRRLRVLFVCEDNGLAIHTPATQRHGFSSIPEVLRGFACHVMSGDGSDVRGVAEATRHMMALMAEEARPGFLHFTYFRFLEHVGIHEDFDAGYRAKPTATELEWLDPVRRCERMLFQEGLSEGEVAAVRSTVDDQIGRSVQRAKAAPFAPASELHTDVSS